MEDVLHRALAGNTLSNQYEFADWWGGLICSVLASALTYYCVAKYADMMAIVRRKSGPRAGDCVNASHVDNEGSETGSKRADTCSSVASGVASSDVVELSLEDTPSCPPGSPDSWATARQSDQIGLASDRRKAFAGHGTTTAPAPSFRQSFRRNAQELTVKTTAILLFLVGFCLFALLDFLSLAILPLTLVIPIVMLVFVWGTIYRFRMAKNKCRYLASKDAVTSISIIVLIGLAVAFAPKGLYVVDLKSIVRWDQKSVVYTAFFIVAAVILHVLRFSPKLSQRVLGWTQLSHRDLNTIIRAFLAGILGGQALVLLKLVAEIIENAVINGTTIFNDSVTIVVVVMSVLTTSLHIYSFHYMLSVLEEENVRLLVPVHRFALILSATVGAAVYLEEWADDARIVDITIYAVSVGGLMAICIFKARNALQELERSSANDERGGARVDLELGGGAFSPRSAVGDSGFRSPRTPGSQTGEANNSFASAKSAGSMGLWDLGLGGKTDEDEDEEDGFFMSSTRSIFHDLPRRRSSGSQSRKVGGLMRGAIMKKAAGSITGRKVFDPRLNYSYPPAGNTMVVKMGSPNPHVDGERDSRWEDPADQPGQWNVRGKTYLSDRLKVGAQASRMRLATMQWTYCPYPPRNCMSTEPEGYIQTAQAGRQERPFCFVVNFMVPGIGNYVSYYVPKPEIEDPVFVKMLNEFCNADDDQFRNDRFKLIPGVKEGSYFVRRAVGAKPALLCNKLTTTYYKSWANGTTINVASGGGHWFEVAIDVSSSRIARSIMGTVKGYASGLTLHMAYLLESKTESELPERLLGGVDLYRPCMTPRPGVPMGSQRKEPSSSSSAAAAAAAATPELGQADSKETAFAMPMLETPPDEVVAQELIDSGAIDFFTDEGNDTDAYSTDSDNESFMSTVDESSVSSSPRLRAPSSPKAMRALNYDYPVPDDTMCVPKGVPNPHAAPGKSFWEDAGLVEGGWPVRGPLYDEDRVKKPCGKAMMKIVAMDWHYAPYPPVAHMAAKPGGFIEKHHLGKKDRPFLVILNFMIPSVGNYVTYLARKRDMPDPVFDDMLAKFINASDDEYRNDRLKLIPGLLEGSYFVRKAVGNKPALLCRKLTTTYYKGDNYFEIDIDVGSSKVGASIFGAVKGFASGLVLHLGVVLESKSRKELPERLLFGIDIHTPSMAPAKQ